VAAVLCLSAVTRGQQAADSTASTEAAPGGAGAAGATFEQRGFVGDNACKTCHQREFESFSSTRHHLDSALPSAASIHGHFDPAHNMMSSLDPDVSFRMSAKNGAFYETSFEGAPGHQKARTETMDIVIGSGAKGQTFLYWRGDELFELPVSYWTSLDRWVNSPGYVDGTANFDRGVNTRCLECHSTYFRELSGGKAGFHFDKNQFVLGISCERCHGPGAEHVRLHSSQAAASPASGVVAGGAAMEIAKMPPVGAERDRQVDICAQCHGGIGHGITPAFSFTPGESLSPHISIEVNPLARVDVHGNQVALLEKSKCFQSSSMTCSTCHNLHEPEREAATYSDKCLTCHQASACPTFSKMAPPPAVTNCIDCHMPLQESNSLRVDLEDQQVPVSVRNHWIRVYPSSGAAHQNSQR
jgi:Cytochrome c554 and c-prime